MQTKLITSASDKGSSIIHFVAGAPKPSSRVAAFDLDGTIIVPASGKKFPRDENDWRWWDNKVPKKLRELEQDGYAIVFISNQAGMPGAQKKFEKKLPLLANALEVPFRVLAALEYDHYRKPGTGLWDLFAESYNGGVDVDLSQSFYVGDAAGRPETPQTPKDHNDTDRKMAYNLTLPFHTPEEFFLSQPVNTTWTYKGWDPKTYDHSKPLFTPTSTPLVPTPADEFGEYAEPEVVIFVGSPGAGKTSFYNEHFKPRGYVHVNQDTLKTRTACLNLVRTSLTSTPPRSCVVDNTNPSASTREEYISLVRELRPSIPGLKIRACWFTASKEVAMHNAVYRASYDKRSARGCLPMPAFVGYWNNFRQPELREGLDEVKEINFKFEGTPEERIKWERWLDVYPKPSWGKK
ncbi:bifunctional polynucleotide phosphatase/kinase [Pseudohyphozyma bogoriensis]|nr:bifunctional polynucleotide phosphatase/kinase [Pseudohyphozyma bogoriensis]